LDPLNIAMMHMYGYKPPFKSIGTAGMSAVPIQKTSLKTSGYALRRRTSIVMPKPSSVSVAGSGTSAI
jgi:hypothetical protein